MNKANKSQKTDNKTAKIAGILVLLAVVILVILLLLRGCGSKGAELPAQPETGTGISYDSAAVVGGWDEADMDKIVEGLNEQVEAGMINISMNTSPVFSDGTSEGNLMIVNEGVNRYLGGGEESYGFLAEEFARDKDSVSAISLMAECLAWAKDKGMSFMEMLQDIYVKYGFSREEGISVVRPGKTGAEEIVAMMKEFRENPPKELGGSPVVLRKDYSDLNCTDTTTGKVEKMDFPVTSNVLQFFTADHTKVSIRPSGTEPKIKFYIEVHSKIADKSEYHAATEAAKAKIAGIRKELGI